MKQWNPLGIGSVAALLLCSTAAQADLTAEQVWQGWVDYYTAMGQQITAGATDMQGDTLVVSDVTFASKAKPEGAVSAAIAEVRLKETGDGRVEITMSNDIPVVMSGKPADGEAFEVKMAVTQSGLAMIASGTPEDTTYDFTASEIGVAMNDMAVDGKAAPMSIDVKMKTASGQSHMIRSGGVGIDSVFAAETVDVAMKGSDPEKPDSTFDLTGSFQGLKGTSKGLIAEGTDMNDLAAALNAGTNFAGDFGYGAGTYQASFSGPEGAGNMNYTGQGGTLHFSMAKEGLAYGGSAGPAQMSVTVPTLPMPLDLSVGESAFDLKMPVAKADTPQPFSLLMKMADLTLSDAIWDMFDPAKNLPRDPATLVIDASGNATLKVDIFDPANAQSEQMPGEVNDVTLSELKLSAVGAELTGSGAVTLDNAAMPPKPVGAVDLKLVGGNALLDKIVAMGFLPADQAAGFRMMLGLFAVPAGEDTLTSKIEFKDDGGVYANGQRIQ